MVKFNNDWDDLLRDEFKKDYFIKLRKFLEEEASMGTILPPKEEIFTAFRLTAYKDVKVVILGQDPYHGVGQSHGLAFSVKPGVKIPPSLRNIFKELEASTDFKTPNNGYLIEWAEQGVLSFNTVLTVREANANSHRRKGWENFTDQVIKYLNDREDPIIFMLWGNNAKDKIKMITSPNHHILTAVHPSPLSASRGFFGCNHFNKANEILLKEGKEPIKWQTSNR